MTLAESTILVVDDEPVLRLTFAVLLRQTGATVLTAQDGIEALEILDAHPVDLVLTDKQMPNMDGMGLLEGMRERGITVPAVLFVNGVVPEDRIQMKRLGVAQTVTKPLQPVDLTRILQSVLNLPLAQ